jgi:DNA ligase-1
LGLVIKKIISEGYNSINDIDVVVGIPVKSALAERERSPEAIIKRLGKCIVEGKYDGFRLQVHHKKGLTKIFSRRAENLTDMFPEFVDLFKDVDVDFIFDSEAIGYNKSTGKYLNFQETIRRKRKYEIKETAKDVPIMLHIFDILYYDYAPTLDLKLEDRRELVMRLTAKINNAFVKPTNAIITDNPAELSSFLIFVLILD